MPSVSKCFYIIHQRYNGGPLLQKINYNQDIEYPPTPSTPSTVKGNVKNVGGSKGAAERGFNAAYADCIHRVIENVPSELAQWQTKVRYYLNTT